MGRDNKNIGKRNNTMTQKLINDFGVKEVKKIWIQFGMYRAAEEISNVLNEYISSSTLRYMSQRFDWKRPVNPKSAIYVGVKRGTRPSSYYKHLIFPEEITNDEK
jgi:hypothetical protein